MAIYEQLGGAQGAGGRVVLMCRKCRIPAEDAVKSDGFLKVCPQCGAPLGEWATEAERDREIGEFVADVRRYTIPPPKTYKILVASGEHAGRYLGMRSGGGFVTNPEVQKKPPVNLEGTKYGLWAQEDGGMTFFEGKIDAVRAELAALGYRTELVEVKPKIRSYN